MSDLETVVENSEESHHLDDIFNSSVEKPITEDLSLDQQGLAGQDGEQNVEDNGEQTKEPQETNDEMSQLKAQFEDLEKRYNESQKFIAKQGNDIGELRKGVTMPTADEFLDKFADDPVKAQQELVQMELDRREAVKAEQDNSYASNRDAILRLVPEFESQEQGIKDWYKAKGASQEFVDSLSSRSLMNNVDLAVALGEIQTLTKQLASTKTKNTNVINKLNSGSTLVSGRSGNSANSDSTIQVPSNITKLSDSQLKDMLKRAQSA